MDSFNEGLRDRHGAPLDPEQIEQLKKAARFMEDLGYRRISRRYGILARIDRSDWNLKVAARNPYLAKSTHAPDYYRRGMSEDRVQMPEVALFVRTSHCLPKDEPGFVRLDNLKRMDRFELFYRWATAWEV